MKKRFLNLVCFLFVICEAFSQKQASEALKAANTQLDKMVSPALTLFMSVCGLFALVGGAVVAYKMFNGDNDSAKKSAVGSVDLLLLALFLWLLKISFLLKWSIPLTRG